MVFKNISSGRGCQCCQPYLVTKKLGPEKISEIYRELKLEIYISGTEIWQGGFKWGGAERFLGGVSPERMERKRLLLFKIRLDF